MSKTTLQTFGLFLALAAVVASVPLMRSFQEGSDSSESHAAGLEVGAVLPPIHGTGWINGSAEDSEHWKGKVIVVHAWANFCPKCHEGMPDLVELHEQFKAKDVVFVGVTTDANDRIDADQQASELAGIQKYISKYHATWPMAYGAIDTLIALKAEYIPGYWVIGRDGKVLWNRGASGKESMRQAIERALEAS
jgi:thiol-disulfide isomerase/thioredoxin